MFKFNIRVNNEHKFKTIVKNTFNFTVKSIDATIIRYINLDTIIRYNSKIASRIVMKTKIAAKNIASSSTKGMLRCKVRMSSLLNTAITIRGKLKSKMRFNDGYYSDISIKVIVNTIGRFKNIIKSDSYDIHTLLRAKGRLGEESTSYQNTQTHMYAKMKLNNLSDEKIILLPYRVKAKKLDVYTDIDLGGLPDKLKNFCFYVKNDNWVDVRDSYAAWEDLERNVTAWEELIK